MGVTNPEQSDSLNINIDPAEKQDNDKLDSEFERIEMEIKLREKNRISHGQNIIHPET